MLSLIAQPAVARDHYYFHRAGVERQQFVADRMTCERLAGGVSPQGPASTMIMVPQSSTLSPGANAATVLIASVFAGLMIRDQRRPVMEAVERTCMADKGYGRYKVEKPVVQSIDRLPQGERIDRYFEMASAAEPTGTRIKE